MRVIFISKLCWEHIEYIKYEAVLTPFQPLDSANAGRHDFIFVPCITVYKKQHAEPHLSSSNSLYDLT